MLNEYIRRPRPSGPSGTARAPLALKVRRPREAVVSHLTALTGLTAELLAARGVALAEALRRLRAALPADACLVGQSIAKDVEWLGLAEGADFGSLVDLYGLCRVWDGARWRHHSLDHASRCLLGAPPSAAGEPHDARSDAAASVRAPRRRARLPGM